MLSGCAYQACHFRLLWCGLIPIDVRERLLCVELRTFIKRVVRVVVGGNDGKGKD
jgi:hypothetical protein